MKKKSKMANSKKLSFSKPPILNIILPKVKEDYDTASMVWTKSITVHRV